MCTPYSETCYYKICVLTHWGRVTHICVGNLTIIGSDNGLSPGRRQAIIWTNAGILLIGPLGTNFSEILVGIHQLSFTKMHLKMSSAKWRRFSLGLNVLTVRHYAHGPRTRYVDCRLRMHLECRERSPRHRGLAIPTCITARAWRTGIAN